MLGRSTTTDTTGRHDGHAADLDLRQRRRRRRRPPAPRRDRQQPAAARDERHRRSGCATRSSGASTARVNAVNPYAFSGAGGFRSGPLPYIKITGTAKSQQDAIDITNQTAVAFISGSRRGRSANEHPGREPRARRAGQQRRARATANGGTKPLLGVGAALLVLLGAAGFALALERLIPRRRRSAAARVAAPAAPERAARRRPEPGTPAPELPALEVPTMTFGAQVEDAVTGEKTKPAPRPRKQPASNGSEQRLGPAAPADGHHRPARRTDHRRRQLARARERLHRPPATRRRRARRAGARSRSRCPPSACSR